MKKYHPWLRPSAAPPFRVIFIISLMLILGACVRSSGVADEPWQPSTGTLTLVPNPEAAQNPYGGNRQPGEPIYTPTPDAPHPIPGLRTAEETYIVESGDTLSLIAQKFNVSVGDIALANNIADINILEVGQELIIPAPKPTNRGPSYKIIPDSELVASPPSSVFDVPDFIYSQNGYLVRYQEDVGGKTLSGPQIVHQIGRDFSVNPRILLAVLEYQSGWVTNPSPQTDTLAYPLGFADPRREGLYKQLAWAADQLNFGFYGWRANALASWTLADSTVIPANPTINAGTAALQFFFSRFYDYTFWEKTVGPEGIFATYNNLFGYPFDYAYEPVVPATLTQPNMQLPFEPGITWAFTGGPHGGWGDGSAWAALDFAPFVDERGCFESAEWVVAATDGLIVRSEDGAVVQDIDSDGKEQTGWTLLYMHIATADRVQTGTYLKAGDRVGHPSCEGGVSNGTHFHIARRYNGEWIPADQQLPFVLDGWVSSGIGSAYDGYLQKDGALVEAYNGNEAKNAIQR